MKLISSIKKVAACCIAFCLLFQISRAVEINVTQSPYNASTSATNNGPAFQSAINALLSAGGGTLYIPAGNWKFSTPIVINSSNIGSAGSLIIRGDGAHVAKQSGGTDLIFTNTTGDAITVSGTGFSGVFPRVFFRELALDGGTQSQIGTFINNHNGLVLQSANGYQLNFVTIAGFNVAGLVITSSSYGSVRDTDIGYCGMGVSCTSAAADQFMNVTVHYCTTAGMQNPQQLVGCTIVNNLSNGIVMSESNHSLSVHDCYFANNNSANVGEGADIDSTSSTTTLAISGHSQFDGTTPEPSGPYRRLLGTFSAVTRTGASKFITTSTYASFDVTGTLFQDASTETQANAANLYWTHGTGSGNAYWYNFGSSQQPILTKP